MAKYMVAVVIKGYIQKLGKTHLMTNSIYLCGFLALIRIQLTFAS